MTQRDIRKTRIYQRAASLYRTLRVGDAGQVSDVAEVQSSPDGTRVIFTGTVMLDLESKPATRIFLMELSDGRAQAVSFGPNSDKLGKYSPRGDRIAFLSDRHQADDFQLYLLDLATGSLLSTPRVDGWVEYFHWSTDGRRILLGVAGHGADTAGGQGAVASRRSAEPIPGWMPKVQAKDKSYQWRGVWMYQLDGNSVRCLSNECTNIWDAAWCGDGLLAVVSSPGPSEGLWYDARLNLVAIATGHLRELYRPKAQLGLPCSSPSGQYVGVLDALSSDRSITCGSLMLISTQSGEARKASTLNVDVAHFEWLSDERLLVAGHRGMETVVASYDARTDHCTEVWKQRELTGGGRYVSVSALNEQGDCALAAESFTRAPQIALIRNGTYRVVKSFDIGYETCAGAIGSAETRSWVSRDGLEIEGWLLRPTGSGPHPVIMNLHGGPVFHWRPMCLVRWAGVPMLMLLQQGYAIFMPNPRGSSGRGDAFCRAVLGDLGGGDAADCLSGLNLLIDEGVVDPKRMGVTGASYGGYMTQWLISHDARIAAAVPVAAVTNFVTEHLLSNIPHFAALFLADTYDNCTGKYYERSPILRARHVRTPTLSICGGLDRCTPPEESMQFHNALLENGTPSVLVTYPEEGHGIRGFPAAIDYAARVVGWFEQHMPVDANDESQGVG